MITVPKFQKFAKSRDQDKDYYVRGTFTRNNLDFSEDVLHFADLGFEQMSIEPVVGRSGRRSHTRSREEDLPKIMEEYDKLAVEYDQARERGQEALISSTFMIDLNMAVLVCGKTTFRMRMQARSIWLLPRGAISIHAISLWARKSFLMGNVDDRNYKT